MNLELFKDTKLACDLPEHRLRRGDIVRMAILVVKESSDVL